MNKRNTRMNKFGDRPFLFPRIKDCVLRTSMFLYLPITFSESFHSFPHHSEYDFQHRVNQIFFSPPLFLLYVSIMIAYVTGTMWPAKRARDLSEQRNMPPIFLSTSCKAEVVGIK